MQNNESFLSQIKLKVTESTELSLIPDVNGTVEVAIFINGHLMGDVCTGRNVDGLIELLQKVSNWDYSDFLPREEVQEAQPLPKYIVEIDDQRAKSLEECWGYEELSDAMDKVVSLVLDSGGTEKVTLHDGHSKRVIGVFGPSIAEWFCSNPFD